MAYRNKTYVCFDADNDFNYYQKMKDWNFHNAHNLYTVNEGNLEMTIKRKLKARLENTKLFLVLLGPQTKFLYKYVKWEIEVALDMGIPIIVVNLNKETKKDTDRCPPILNGKLCLHLPFSRKKISWAIDNWKKHHSDNLKKGVIKDFHW
jgi:cellobiose-specific phosphotransferase system component IIB